MAQPDICALLCPAVILRPSFLLADEPGAAGRSGLFRRPTAGRVAHDRRRSLTPNLLG
jgi:hypothetical protein